MKQIGMKKFFVAFMVLAILGSIACNRKGAFLPAEKVSATEEYRKYFGPPPTTDKGRCFAFVLYFSLAEPSGKLVPFPFFTFDESTMMKVAVERLLGGMDQAAYRGEFFNPFPAGARLISLTEKQGTVTLDISRFGSGDQAVKSAGRNALFLTLRQFSGVKRVDLLIDGTRTELTAPELAAVKEPGLPRLLSVVASQDPRSAHVEDVSALFDRPVMIKELQFLSEKGEPFSGEVYHSVFDMAAVLKPKAPSLFKRGMPIKVRWKVVDKMGRKGSAEEVRYLALHER